MTYGTEAYGTQGVAVPAGAGFPSYANAYAGADGSVVVPGETAVIKMRARNGSLTVTDEAYPGYELGYEPIVTTVPPAEDDGGALNSVIEGQPAVVTMTGPFGDLATSVVATAPPSVALMSAPPGEGRVVVSGGLASEVQVINAPPGDVEAVRTPPLTGAVDGEPARVSVRSHDGQVATSTASSPQVPRGAVARLSLAALPGQVSQGPPTGSTGGATTGKVEGSTASLVFDAPAGEARGLFGGGIPGPVVKSTITAPQGEVTSFTVDRAQGVLTLDVLTADVPVQPGVVNYRFFNGTPNSTVYVFLDDTGPAIASATVEADGSGSGSVGISGLSTGIHYLTIGATTAVPVETAFNYKSFNVSGSAAPPPPAPIIIAPPPRVVDNRPIRRWVFQSDDGTETYELPRNPERSTPVYGEWALSSEPTADGNKMIEWEGSFKPVEWRFGGRVFTKAEHDQFASFCQRSKRIYVTDHYGHRFRVKVSSLQTTRVRDRARPWHHSYEITCWVLAGDGVLV